MEKESRKEKSSPYQEKRPRGEDEPDRQLRLRASPTQWRRGTGRRWLGRDTVGSWTVLSLLLPSRGGRINNTRETEGERQAGEATPHQRRGMEVARNQSRACDERGFGGARHWRVNFVVGFAGSGLLVRRRYR